MKFEISERIKTTKHASTVMVDLEGQFRKVASQVENHGDKLVVQGIEATFGSINRTDITVIHLKTINNGFLCIADVDYRPSAAFWILLIILIFTSILWLLPIFFYLNQKKMVRTAIENVFIRVKNEVEEELTVDVYTKKCPSCAETIKLEAKICRFCGHQFNLEQIQTGIEWAKKEFESKELEEKNTVTPEQKEKLFRGLCPNCDAYQAFERDKGGSRLTCEVCKSRYYLYGENRVRTEPVNQRRVEVYTEQNQDLEENNLSSDTGDEKRSLPINALNAIHDKDFDLAISLPTKEQTTPGSLTDQHFTYNALIEASMKKKDYTTAKKYCLEALEDFAEIGNALRDHFDGELPATIPCRDNLLDIVVDIEKDYDEAEHLINVFVQKRLLTHEEAEAELEGIKLSRLYTMAEEMLRHGNYHKAESISEEIITINKCEAPQIYKMMGNHYLENKMKYEAVQYFQKAISADPLIVGVKRKLSKLTKELGAEVESNDSEKEVLKTLHNNEKPPNEWRAKRDLANKYVKSKEYDRAWKLFNEALVLRSNEGMPCDTIYPYMAKMREEGKGYKDAVLLYLLAFKEGLRMDEREPARYVSQGIDRCVRKLGIKNVTHSQLYELVKERPKLDAMRTLIDELVSEK